MASKRQRTTFAKNQREKARMEKAAEKRARRQARKDELERGEPSVEGFPGFSPAIPDSADADNEKEQ